MKRLLCISKEYEELKQQFIKMVEACEHPRCSECGSDEVNCCHHSGDFIAPECDYFQCMDCGHQWGFE